MTPFLTCNPITSSYRIILPPGPCRCHFSHHVEARKKQQGRWFTIQRQVMLMRGGQNGARWCGSRVRKCTVCFCIIPSWASAGWPCWPCWPFWLVVSTHHHEYIMIIGPGRNGEMEADCFHWPNVFSARMRIVYVCHICVLSVCKFKNEYIYVCVCACV